MTENNFTVPCKISRVANIWKLEIQAPNWLLDDIADSEQSVTITMPQILDRDIGSFYGYVYEPKNRLLANAHFEWVEGKKVSDE